MSLRIYHTLVCGTSRNTLAIIRNAGIVPVIIEYLKSRPSRIAINASIARAGLTVRAALREKETRYANRGLGGPSPGIEQLLDAMLEHPILIDRPLVVTPLGVRLCRPSEVVLDILPAAQKRAFANEDGEPGIDSEGRRVHQ